MGFRFRVLLALMGAMAAVTLTVGLIAALGGTLWQDDGVVVCAASNPQSDPKIAPDGAGGAIVVWHDSRDVLHGLYAQRVNGDGSALWTTDGVTLSLPSGTAVSEPRIAPDGSGGAVVAWTRSGTGWDIYAQRVYSDGTLAWLPADVGVSLSTTSSGQLRPQIVSDGAGGGIVAWEDYRSGSEYDIYAQRVYSDGTVAWTTDGVSLSVAANNQEDLQIVSDGAEGAIVVWKDERDSGTTLADIYVQRVYSDGNTLWATDGVSLHVADYNQKYPKIASDGSGGAIVTWQDYNTSDLHAQRVYSDGTMAWPAGGVSVCTASNAQFFPDIAPDGSGGAVLAWQDSRVGSDGTDIYAQRIDGKGNTLWMTDGVSVCLADDNQRYPEIASDGFGGAIVTWWDSRDVGITSQDIYAQWVDASGNIVWQTDGISVSVASGDQDFPEIAADALWGAIISWEDSRGADDDIYAQRVGVKPVHLPLVVRKYPN